MLSVFDQGPPPPCPTPFNLAAHVLARAGELGDKPALEVIGGDAPRRIGFAELERAVRGIGTGLLRAGLAPGDRVMLRLGNTPEFPLAYLGAIAVGIVPVPTSPQLTAPECARLIADLRPAALLHDPAIACPDGATPVFSVAEIRDATRCDPCDYAMGDPDRPGYIIYTSGTSGRPRAVVHAHRAIWARRMMHDAWYGLTGADRLAHAGAFNWTFTLGTGLMDPWSVGATALIPAPGTDPARLPALLTQHDVTIFAAAPGIYRQMLKQLDWPALPALRHGLSAGEKLSPDVARRWTRATGTAVHEAFGMSECSTFISGAPDRPAHPDRLGHPQPGRRLAILGIGDGDGPVPRGAEGIIAIHRADPGLMLGYLGAPDETRQKYRGDWFLTGDLGRMEEDGQITYLGRADDMMNAGGVRVSPIEVEEALAGFPGLAGIAATDVALRPDLRVIAAFYTGPAPLDEDALRDWAQTRLARYKQPRLYRYLPQLPTNANGKLNRRALRDGFRP